MIFQARIPVVRHPCEGPLQLCRAKAARANGREPIAMQAPVAGHAPALNLVGIDKKPAGRQCVKYAAHQALFGIVQMVDRQRRRDHVITRRDGDRRGRGTPR